MKKLSCLLLLLIAVGLAIVLQGLLLVEIIPLSLVSIVLGVNVSSPFNFFVFPFAYFILKFLYIAVKQIFILKFFKASANPSMLATEFFGFLLDFFVWVISFWLMGIAIFVLLVINYIPNKNPPLFFVSLNLFIGFFIMLQVLKGKIPIFSQINRVLQQKGQQR
jgi:hypothetical protein